MYYSFRPLLGVFAIFIISLVVAQNVQAETYFWQHPGTELTITVPDTWRMKHNQKPDDVMTFIAPSRDAFPVCRMRVRQDRRFVIYPHRFMDEVQHLYYSSEFWDDYAAEFPLGFVEHYANDAGLGRGYGSFAEITFAPDAAPMRPRKALAFAAIYRDKAYIFECSANHEFYDSWLPAFMSIAKSVKFRQERAQLPGGHYKQLFGAPAIEIMGRRDIDTYYGYGRVPN